MQVSFEQDAMRSGWGNLTDNRSQIPCWIAFLVPDGHYLETYSERFIKVTKS